MTCFVKFDGLYEKIDIYMSNYHLKKMFSVLFALAASKAKPFKPSMTFKPFPEWANKTREAVVISKNGLKLYNSTSFKNKKVIMVIPKGQTVTVTGAYPIRGLLRIKYNETVGYGYGSGIRFTTNATIGKNIANAAKEVIGCQYVYGMAGPKVFDNAGLVYYAHKTAGVKIPRLAKDMYQKGQIVIRQTAQPGDILCFLKDTNQTTKVPSMAIVTYARSTNITYVGIFKPDTVVAEGSVNIAKKNNTSFFGKYSFKPFNPFKKGSYEIRRFW